MLRCLSSLLEGFFSSAMALEDIVYVICEGSSGPLSICGWVVSLPGDDAVVGTSTKATAGLAHTAKAKQGEHEISFVRVPLSAVTEQPPSGWKGVKPRDLPPSKACVAAWKTLGKGGAELESSGAEMPRTSKAPGRARRSLKEDLKDLQGLWDDEEGDEDETDDEDDARPSTRQRGGSMVAPGAKNKGSDRREKERDEDDLDLRKLVRKGLASGQSPNDLMPLLMMALALDKGESRKKKKSKEAGRDLNLLGFSDSDGSSGDEAGHLGKGMQAVATLHRLHESIRKRPRRIIQQFEAEVARELGVIPGQPWTLNDWVRRQSWGKFKGLQRAAVQDVEVYELLRNGEAAAAAAQVIQNLKSKVQCVLQGGDWQTAWLLTGLEDPLSKKEFAGSKQEMAIVSSYVKALHDLKKKVREGHAAAAGGGDEDGDAQASGSRK